MLELAIVGGGPGGLMSAWYLKKKLGDLCRITIFEATDRVGGKVVTRKFDSAPAMYEAGNSSTVAPFMHGMVGYWPFDDNNNSTSTDSSGPP